MGIFRFTRSLFHNGHAPHHGPHFDLCLFRLGYRGLEALPEHGYQTVLIPDEVMRLRARGRFETCPYGYQNGIFLEKVRFFGKSSG